MLRRPPRSTRTDTLFPYTTLFRSALQVGHIVVQVADGQRAQIGADHATPGLRRIVFDNHGEAPIPCVRIVIILEQDAILAAPRSEEHTSELQSLMRISYAVFCLKKKNTVNTQ